MANVRTKEKRDSSEEMRRAFEAARFSEVDQLFQTAKAAGEPLNNATQLLQGRTLLKRDVNAAAGFLLNMRLTKPSPLEAAMRDMYLGMAYARLRNFAQADRHFAAARPAMKGTKERAELANQLSRRSLLAGDVAKAAEWQVATLCDKSRMGRIRSAHLRSFVASHRCAYAEEARDVVTVLDLIGNDVEAFPEDWYHAVHTAAALARELPLPDLATRAQQEVDRKVEWPEDFSVIRFQALKSVAWSRALSGDNLSCLRYLRSAQQVAPSDAWRSIVYVDRAFFALVMNERRWAENEFALAQDLAESINWEATRGEERVALLLLAELSALFDPERGKYYISRYDHLDRMRSNLVQTAFDDRLPAIRDFANGVVMAATGRRSDAEQSLRKAWRIFDDIGYDMRAGRVAAALYRVTEKNRWRHLAEDKFEAYPHSWLYHELAVGQRSDRAAPDLTPMQDRIMRLVRQGLSTDEIASHLGRSRNTVLNHLKIVYKKLGVNSREGLVAEALRRGLVS